MQYFKNVDLTKMYPVSEKAVRNWIAAAKEGKLDLILHEEDGKAYIANVAKNIAFIQKLAEERKKYANSRSKKVVRAKDELYVLYNDSQLLDIISDIKTYHEVPNKYSYFDNGAEYWDQYTEMLAKEQVPNMFNSIDELVNLNISYIDEMTKSCSKVNIIDIGPGNGRPIRNLLSHLKDRGVLGRYIALDISKDMLEIVERNISDWFNDSIAFEGYVRDIAYDRFADLIASEKLQHGDDVVNIAIVLGGTLNNFRDPNEAFQTIHSSINKGDLFIHAFKLDSARSRQFFHFNEGDEVASLSNRDKRMLDLLSIDESMYDVEQEYNEELKARTIHIQLKIAVSVKLKIDGEEYSLDLDKGDKILLWRYWHLSSLDALRQLEASKFDYLQASQTDDHDYLLTISRIKDTA